jgi:hypothetical protein
MLRTLRFTSLDKRPARGPTPIIVGPRPQIVSMELTSYAAGISGTPEDVFERGIDYWMPLLPAIGVLWEF